MRYVVQRGFSVLVIPLVLCFVLLIGAVVFGGWAYSKMQDYKTNVDAKVSVAVEAAKLQEANAKDVEYAQKEKLPFRTYTGPAAYGSVVVKYPKTWSAYVSDDHNNSPFVDGYFYPNVVPDITGDSSAFALRVQVVGQSYSTVLSSFDSLVKQGKARVAPYTAPNAPSVVGARIDGQLLGKKSGSMVVFPLRNMTLTIWTEAPQFQDDFNNNVLPNFTFSP